MGESQKRSNAKWMKYAVLGGSLVVGGVFGGMIGRLLKSAETSGVDTPWWAILTILPSTWLVVAWHELGHAVGGWWSGLQMILFMAGPLKIVREGDALRWRYNDNLTAWGGLAAMAPLGGKRLDAPVMRQAMIRVVAGGPLFSFLGAVLLLVPAYLMLGKEPGWVTPVLGFPGAMSLLIGILTLVPNSAGGYKSDGLRLLMFFRGDGATATRWCNLATLSGLSQTMRPRDWPEDMLLGCGAVEGDRSHDGVSAAWLQATYYEDRRELEKARTWVLEAVEGAESWPELARPYLSVAAAAIHARLGDATTARRYADEVREGGLLQKFSKLYTEALVLEAEGRAGEARAAAEGALREIGKQPKGTQLAAREDLERILTLA
ncbi:hypothetical protein F183_A38300 [Bryobacterales bacterium F-183]|nr:hypothetical protein F183_A38300 [Bryobacterales bacterium F-183]